MCPSDCLSHLVGSPLGAADVMGVLMDLQEASNDRDDALVGGDNLLGLEARPLVLAPERRQRVGLPWTPWHGRCPVEGAVPGPAGRGVRSTGPTARSDRGAEPFPGDQTVGDERGFF